MNMINFLRKIISYDNPVRILWHRLKGILAAIKYGFPGKKMVIIGITGTNGKTTTTHMLEHILRESGKKVAMLSTSEFVINGKRELNESKKTTMSPFLTQKFLKKCLNQGIEYVIIEASSHSLHQSRLWGVDFAIAAITNITHEHLDYHGDIEKYAEAKKILFNIVSKTCLQKKSKKLENISHQNASVLNIADAYYDKFNKVSCPLRISYGFDQGTLQARNATYTKHGARFDLSYQGGHAEISLNLTGEFNVENAMAAAGASLACKLSLKEIQEGLNTFEGVAGRMERIKSKKGYEVIVDFALTPDALERLYEVIKKTATGRVIGLIGSCGDRDKKKRPEMGRIVAKYCDLTIVTDEEPYSEPPMDIMQAIFDGAKEVKSQDEELLLIKDRKDAIEHAIKNAQENDIIVVTGMGSFTTRTLNNGPIEWDDREVARELINKYS